MPDLRERDVLVDLCTQREYLSERGSLICVNASQVIANVKHIIAYARVSKSSLLSCVDIAQPRQIGHEHAGITGNGEPRGHKLPFTILRNHAVVHCDNSLSMSLNVFEQVQQVVFTKVHRDPFTNPKVDRLLTEMPVRRFVVFGAPLETSVRILILGLIRRQRRVALLSDACGYCNESEAQMVLRQVRVKGCGIYSTREFIEEGMATRPKTRSVA